MFAVSNRKANRLLKTKRKRGVTSGFMTTTTSITDEEPEVKKVKSSDAAKQEGEDQKMNVNIHINDDDDDDTKLFISSSSSVKDNGLYENDTKLLKFIFLTCYQLETFMFLYDFFTLVGENEKDNNTQQDNNANNTVFGTQKSHFEYLANNGALRGGFKPTTSEVLKQEEVQTIIVNVSLEEEEFKRKICSFPNLRIVHESISTCPLAMSECTVNYTVLVLEVKIYSLYRQFILNESNKSSTVKNNQHYARVIADEDVFMEMKETWKSYVFTEKFKPHGRRGSDTLNHANIDTALWSQYADKNNTYLTFLQKNGLMSPTGEPVTNLPSLSSSIFVNYCSFKIEEIQKGTCVNRLKKRIQLEVGPHTLIKYVSIFAEMYKAFITDVKDANKIISDYEAVKQKSLKQQQHDIKSHNNNKDDTTTTTAPVRRGRKRKNTEDIIGQYKTLENKKSKYESTITSQTTTTQIIEEKPTAPDLHTLAAVASSDYEQQQQHHKQALLNDKELQFTKNKF